MQLPGHLLDPVETEEHVLVLQLVNRHRVLALKDIAIDCPVGGKHQLCQLVNVGLFLSLLALVSRPSFKEK